MEVKMESAVLLSLQKGDGITFDEDGNYYYVVQKELDLHKRICRIYVK
jgi:hypothetical protein